jgi:integrase
MTTAKGGRPATGTVKWRFNPNRKDPVTGKPAPGMQWWGRVREPNGKRPFVALRPEIPQDDRAGALTCAVEFAKQVRDNPTVAKTVGETVDGYAKRWLADREGRIKSLRSDRGRLERHVLGILGSLDVRTFNRDDVERLRDDLDRKIVARKLSWKTAANVWTVVTSMADEMVNAKRRELRVRQDNPYKDVRPPERGSRKAKQYLYPSEFLALVSCDDVPLRWRRAVAVAVYTYARDGELRELRWDGGDVDLEHGVLSITRAYNQSNKRVEETKTGDTRRFAIEKNLLPLLRAMQEEKGGKAAKGTVLSLAPQGNMARGLRTYLKRAGVTRPELHVGTATRKPMTFHDLRSTGATWMAVRGDDPLKIKQRCGHASFATTEIYIREAEAVRVGFGDVFPPLPASLLEPPPVWQRFGTIQTGRPRKAKNKRDSVPKEGLEASQVAESTKISHESRAGDPPRVDVSAREPVASGPTEMTIEAVLVKALGEAAAAGRFDVVAQLAKELEARRLAPTA